MSSLDLLGALVAVEIKLGNERVDLGRTVASGIPAPAVHRVMDQLQLHPYRTGPTSGYVDRGVHDPVVALQPRSVLALVAEQHCVDERVDPAALARAQARRYRGHPDGHGGSELGSDHAGNPEAHLALRTLTPARRLHPTVDQGPAGVEPCGGLTVQVERAHVEPRHRRSFLVMAQIRPCRTA